MVKYLAVLGTDGKPRVAFNACDVCGGAKGYVQKGTDIKCLSCGREFKIDGLGTENKGSPESKSGRNHDVLAAQDCGLWLGV